MANIDTTNLVDLAILTQQQLGGRGFLGIEGGTEGIPGAPQVPYTIKKPWIDEPDGSIPVITKQATALGVVGTIVTVTLLALEEGFDAVINQISNNITGGGFQDGSGDLLWTFLIDNRPITGLNNLNSENGSSKIPIKVSPIRIRGGQTLTGQCNHVANVALAGNVIMGALGYKYPRQATE